MGSSSTGHFEVCLRIVECLLIMTSTTDALLKEGGPAKGKVLPPEMTPFNQENNARSQ